MSIYLPGDLKERMEECPEPTNWSELAVNAFEKYLGEVASRKETKTMADVIQRLRATRLNAEGEDVKLGMAIGRQWAQLRATARELDRLNLYVESYGADFESSEHNAFCAAEILACHLRGEEQTDRGVAREFWINEGLDSPPHDSMLTGFVRGALAIWGEVQDKI
jgi:hypothetical protein